MAGLQGQSDCYTTPLSRFRNMPWTLGSSPVILSVALWTHTLDHPPLDKQLERYGIGLDQLRDGRDVGRLGDWPLSILLIAVIGTLALIVLWNFDLLLVVRGSVVIMLHENEKTMLYTSGQSIVYEVRHDDDHF